MFYLRSFFLFIRDWIFNLSTLILGIEKSTISWNKSFIWEGDHRQSNKIFTGNGNFSGSSTGFFADSSGRFSLKNKISYDDTTSNLVLKPDTLDLDATNIEVSSTQASMSLGEGKIKLIGGSTSTITIGASNSLTLSDDGTDRFLVIGSKSSFSQFDQSTAGIIFGTDNGTTKFEVVGDSDNYISFNGSSFDIKSETFDLATTNVHFLSI